MKNVSLVKPLEAPIDRPNLYHYSNELVRLSSLCPRKAGGGFSDRKPDGIWVSIDAPDEDGEAWGWFDFCVAESYNLAELTIRHRIRVSNTERILWITTESDLIWFDKTFGSGRARFTVIDWQLVADQFAGIIIAPYQNGLRLEIDWYYGWDCASGCIWDTSIIDRVSVVS